MAKDNDPILAIPSSKNPRNAEPTLVRLMYDTPLEKQKDQGMLYIYKVTAVSNCHKQTGDTSEPVEPGTQMIMFAWDGLNRAINETEAAKNDVIEIVRTGEGKRTRWYVDLSVVADSETSAREAQQDSRSDPPKTSKGWHKAPAPQTASGGLTAAERFDHQVNRYLHALDLARVHTEQREIPYQVDLNAMAFAFYKMAEDAGYDPTKDETPAAADDEEVSHAKASVGTATPEEAKKMESELSRIFTASHLPKKDWFLLLELVHKNLTGYTVDLEKSWELIDPAVGRKAYTYAKEVHDTLRGAVQEAAANDEELPPSELARLAEHEWQDVFYLLEGGVGEMEDLPF